MSNKLKCYLRCLKSSHADVFLPNTSPVIVGRMPALKIDDSTCSRNQLELRAYYNKRYVLVKRLGVNSSQIEGIDIAWKKSSKLDEKQTLYIVNMKYPHTIVFETDGEKGSFAECETLAGTSHIKEAVTTSCSITNKIEVVTPCNTVKRSTSKEDVDQKYYNKRACKDTNNKDVKDTGSDFMFKSSTPKVDNIPIQIFNNTTAVAVKQSATSHNKPKSHMWNQGLKAAMADPELIIFQDELVVVIKDKYPKAQFHWLVLPLESITTASHLRPGHTDLLKHMLKVGETISLKEAKGHQFRYGYHAIASMSQLHMHVISQDFCSSAMKTKKHWNSFTTDYFVDAATIIKELENDGKVRDRKSYTTYLKESLRCHKCHDAQKNIPTLKKHIAACKRDVATG